MNRVTKPDAGDVLQCGRLIVVAVVVILLGLHQAPAAYPPLLAEPRFHSGEVTFALFGETHGAYELEHSSTMGNWTPFLTNQARSSRRLISVESAGTMNFYRAVRLPGPLFRYVLAVRDKLDLNGHDLIIDSFDSQDDTYSTGGVYDPDKALDRAEVALVNGATNSLATGSMRIKGVLSTRQGTLVPLGAQGSVGSESWVEGGMSGFQNGHYFDDLSIHLRTNQVPWKGGAWTPGSGVHDGLTYNYILNSGNYQMSALFMSGSSRMAVIGNAQLYLTGNVLLTGAASIHVFPGACLRMHVAGATANIQGGSIINEGNATNFVLYALPSNASLTLAINGSLAGAIYAPDSEMVIVPNETAQFSGACIAKGVRLEGTMRLRYDHLLERSLLEP